MNLAKYVLPYMGRVVEERDELEQKILRLEAFLRTNTYGELPRQKRKLLTKQHQLMCDYKGVLDERLRYG